MSSDDHDRMHTFNLKAVVQEIGLTPDTLRAWERRYGLPQPQRSTGGHRLYSQRDINILKWLVARQEEGLNISKAVDLWNRLEDGGQDPLRMAEYAIPLSAVVSVATLPAESLTELCEAWVHACLAFDEQSAEQVLSGINEGDPIQYWDECEERQIEMPDKVIMAVGSFADFPNGIVLEHMDDQRNVPDIILRITSVQPP